METTAPLAPRGTNFYRSPTRVAVLMFFADVAYLWWWLWQLFHFTKREGFHTARSFWWLLVPFYGLYVLYQQLDDLDQALRVRSSPTIARSMPRNHWTLLAAGVLALVLAMATVIFANTFLLGNNEMIKAATPFAVGLGVYLWRRIRPSRQYPVTVAALISIGGALIIPTLNPVLFVAWAFLSDSLDSSGVIASIYLNLILYIVFGLVLAAATYVTQRDATTLLEAKYPEERRRGFGAGEIAATFLGLLMNAIVLFGPVLQNLHSNRVAPTGAHYSYIVPAGFHEAHYELPSGVTGLYLTGIDSDKPSDVRDGIFGSPALSVGEANRRVI